MKNQTSVLSIAATALLGAALSLPAVEVSYSGSDPAAKYACADLERILAPVKGKIVLERDGTMRSQEWRLKTRADGTLVISGRDGMALAYGVYSLLEDYAGVRWFAADTEIVPNLSKWRLPKLDVTGRPAILDREMFVSTDYMDGYWRLRNKETFRVAFAAGVCVGRPFACHTFAHYAKAAIKDDSLCAINSKGKIDKGNLCMTKKEVRRLVAEQMLRYIAADREKKVPAGREYTYPSIYELSQNDGDGSHCHCKECVEFSKREGSWAGPNIDFVNAVADIVGKVHPEITIRTFAYSYTELPPKTVRARDNVQVRFCRSFVFAPLVRSTYNGNVLEKWNSFAAQKSVWGYWRQYAGGFYPMVKSRRDIAEEMRFCRDCGVTGYFAEAESPLSRCFGLMQDWLFLKTAENPDRDMAKLSREFMRGYYGAAAEAMERLLTALEDGQQKVFARLDMDYISRMDSGNMAMYAVRAGFPDRAFFEEADRCLDEAERLAAAAGDARSLRHVREERAVIDRSVFDNWPRLEKEGYRADLKAKAIRYGEAKRMQIASYFKAGSGRLIDEERKKRLAELESEVGYLSAYPLATPEKFADAADILTLNWNNCGMSSLGVKDEEALGGYAKSIPVGKNAKTVIFGYYQSVFKKMGDEVSFKLGESSGPGYKLYCIAKDMEMISPHYIYLNGWHRRIWLPAVGLPMEKRDVWINAKVTENGELRFDRVFLVKNKDK
jgi:hypothetical protein